MKIILWGESEKPLKIKINKHPTIYYVLESTIIFLKM